MTGIFAPIVLFANCREPGMNPLAPTAVGEAGIQASQASEAGDEPVTTTTTALSPEEARELGADPGAVRGMTSHRSGATLTANSITLTGTATDSGRGNSGVASVTVNGTAARNGTASGSGTASWSWTGALVRGNNVFTVVATDASAARNRTARTVTIRKP